MKKIFNVLTSIGKTAASLIIFVAAVLEGGKNDGSNR